MIPRRAITMRGLPARKPTMTPYAAPTFEGLLAFLEELRAMHANITQKIPLVEKALATFKDIKQGDPGLPGTPGRHVTVADVEAAVRKFLIQPKDGASLEPEDVAQEALASPKFAKLLARAIKDIKLPKQDVAPELVVAKVLEGLTAKPLGMHQVKGLEARLTQIHNHVRSAQEWRGGGDTVVAGSGVTITNTVNGNKQISATGGVGNWSTPPETPNGVTTVFTVGVSAPTDVVADGATFYNGAGYTYAAGQITFVNPPTQYVRYR